MIDNLFLDLIDRNGFYCLADRLIANQQVKRLAVNSKSFRSAGLHAR